MQKLRPTSAEAQRLHGIAGGAYGLQLFMIRREQGRLEEMRPVLRLLSAERNAGGIWRPGLVVAYAELGMFAEARAGFDEMAVNRFADLPRDGIRPLVLSFLADTCVRLADRNGAAMLLEQLHDQRGICICAGVTTNAGPADRFRAAMAELSGRHDLADQCIRSASQLARASGSPVWHAHVEHTWAWMAALRGDRAGVAEHFAASRRVAAAIGMGSIPVEPPQAVEPMPIGRAPVGTALPAGLSDREAEVLALLAEGQTNRAIAGNLCISPNTAANHVRAILQKTGTANRTEAAAYAARHGLNTACGNGAHDGLHRGL